MLKTAGNLKTLKLSCRKQVPGDPAASFGDVGCWFSLWLEHRTSRAHDTKEVSSGERCQLPTGATVAKIRRFEGRGLQSEVYSRSGF